jgi:hypothetical protein
MKPISKKTSRYFLHKHEKSIALKTVACFTFVKKKINE